MTQEGKSESTFAPRTTHTDLAHPASFRVVVRDWTTQIETRNFPGGSIDGDEHEGWVNVACFPMMLPCFEGLFHKTEMITEGVSIGSIDSLRICFRAVGTNGDACGKFWFGRRGIHFDQHMIQA